MAKQSSRNEKRAQKLQQEQEALNRVFRLFLIGILAECYLLVMYNKFIKGSVQEVVTSSYVVTVLGYAGVAVLLLGLILALAFHKKRPGLGKVSSIAAGVGAFFAVSSALMYWIYPSGTIFLLVLVPILTVLGLVYNLYQREFFLTAVILSGSIFTLWLCGKGLGTLNWNTKVTVGAVLVLLGLLAAAYLTHRVEKNNGKWLGKNGVRMFTPACSYPLLYATYAVCFITILLALVLVSTTYYTIWILGIVLFALAVYYTSKLM